MHVCRLHTGVLRAASKAGEWQCRRKMGHLLCAFVFLGREFTSTKGHVKPLSFPAASVARHPPLQKSPAPLTPLRPMPWQERGETNGTPERQWVSITNDCCHHSTFSWVHYHYLDIFMIFLLRNTLPLLAFSMLRLTTWSSGCAHREIH